MDTLRSMRGVFYKEYRSAKREQTVPSKKKQKVDTLKTYLNESSSSGENYFHEDIPPDEVHEEDEEDDEDDEDEDEDEDEEEQEEDEEAIDDEQVLDLRTEEDCDRNEELNSKPDVGEDLSPYASFDIGRLIKSRINAQQNDNRRSANSKTVLFEGSELQLDDFKFKYQRLVNSNGLTAQCAFEVLELIRSALPNKNNLPSNIGCTFNDIECVSNQSKCRSVFEMHSCDCGSTIYVGDYTNSTACPTCNNRRFTSADNRYPVSLFSYRSIILILFELLQTNEFYNTICNTTFADFRDNAHVDVMDGDVAKRHVDEMKRNFEEYQSNDTSILPLNLLFCLQYDGAQIFHHSVTNFWPLLLTILNLPPNLRKCVGVGTFMISLFTAYSNSLCENFLFKKLLVQELQLLYEGYILNVREKIFYIQARLILHCYDSKALESVVKVQGTNSLAGCSLCRLAPGWGLKKKMLPAATYAGHRRLLPRSHYLRSCGQSGKCCPKLYYTDIEVLESSFLNSDQQPAKQTKDIAKIQNKCNNEEIVLEDGYLTVSNEAIVDLKAFLFFHHCDFRSFFKYERVSNKTYIKDGKSAAAQQSLVNQRSREYRHSTLAIRKKGKVVNVNGVKDVWAFAQLPYVDVSENVCYDPFHVFNNIITYVFKYLTGQRKINVKAKEFCRKTLCHPRVYNSVSTKDNKTKEIWQLTEAQMKDIEEKFLKALILPLGFKSHFRISILFSQMGNIRGKEKINIFECAMDLLCHAIATTCSDYPTEYLLYFCLLSKLISDLSAPVMMDNEIENLYQRVVELVCVHEGLFPVSETKMVFHQLIDLPHFIKKFGPVRGWWTLPSERGIAIIKRKLTEGNYHKYYKRVYTNEFTDEFLESVERYSTKQELYQSTRDDVTTFSDFQTDLLYENRNENRYTLSVYQIKEYIKFMLNEFGKVDLSDNVKELRSPLLRIQKYFETNSRSGNFTDGNGKSWKFNKSEFVDFLEKLSNNSINDLQYVLEEDENNSVGTVSQKAWDKVQKNNKIFKKDFQFIQKLFDMTYHVSFFRKALIGGIKFRGRGVDYLEIDEPKRQNIYGQLSEHEVFSPSNSNNDWKAERNKKTKEEALLKAASSLCMVKNAIRKGKKSDGINMHFCQVNMFGRIHEPMEELINKTLFAFVVTRDCTNVSLRVNSNYHSFENLYSSKLTFLTTPTIVNIKDIYPCPVAIAPKQSGVNELLIILLQRNRQKLLDKDIVNQLYTETTNNSIKIHSTDDVSIHSA